LLMICIQPYLSNGQCSNNNSQCGSTAYHNKKLGLYINYFFNFDPANGDWNNPVDQPHTVLCSGGPLDPITNLYPDEKILLDYIRQHGFTSLAFFGVYNMLYDPTHPYGTSTIANELKRFISIAKTQYGVTEVSACIGKGTEASFVGSYNLIPWQANCGLPPQFAQISNMQIGPSNIYNDPYLNALRTVLAVYNFNASSLSILAPDPIGCDDLDLRRCVPFFDRMVTEIEWWHGTNSDNETVFQKYCSVMEFMHCIKANSCCPMKLDTYIGSLKDVGSRTEQNVADIIDGYSDRVYLASYWCNPKGSNFDVDCIYDACLGEHTNPRPTLFGNNAKANTEIWPIFSAESSSFGINYETGDNWENNLGDYLLSHPCRLITAENDFLDDHQANLNSANPYSWGDNNFSGFQWFVSGILLQHNINRLSNSDQHSSMPTTALIINNKSEFHIEEFLLGHKFEIFNLSGSKIVAGLIDGNKIEVPGNITEGLYLFVIPELNYRKIIIPVE
jgi:hypothetical protein